MNIIIIIIADMTGIKREASFSQKELSIERHQKDHLQSKLNALESQMVSQKREMLELEGDAKEKILNAGNHVKQTRQEVSSLKAKVRADS